MPFPKGVRGSPGGRTKEDISIRKAIAQVPGQTKRAWLERGGGSRSLRDRGRSEASVVEVHSS